MLLSDLRDFKMISAVRVAKINNLRPLFEDLNANLLNASVDFQFPSVKTPKIMSDVWSRVNGKRSTKFRD